MLNLINNNKKTIIFIHDHILNRFKILGPFFIIIKFNLYLLKTFYDTFFISIIIFYL
jgi:hypothetical protein